MKRKGHGEIADLIGEAGLIRLAEAFGGTRLYVPAELPADHQIIKAVGPVPAARLSRYYGNTCVTVPLARELRACVYRDRGLSHAKIARRLGITEGAVEKLFRRVKASEPAK